MLVVIVSLLCVVSLPRVDADAVSWNYHTGEHGGPDTWSEAYPDCGGVMQSPIEIETEHVLYDPELELFDTTDYSKTDGVTLHLVNKGGHTAEVMYTGDEIRLKGGSLPQDYTLDQFHFHWGADDGRGSEHGMDGEHFPMEMHIVHHQTRMLNVTAAAPRPHGLAVIGFFFKVGQHNDKYDQLLDHFDDITDADEEVTISTFPLSDLLPEDYRLDYYRYPGSLTTPPCYESVIWSIATQKIEISEEQLNKFRSLHDSENQLLVNDYRPVQPRNRRTVLTTHHSYNTENDD